MSPLRPELDFSASECGSPSNVSVISSGYSGFFHHVNPQNVKFRVSVSFLCNWSISKIAFQLENLKKKKKKKKKTDMVPSKFVQQYNGIIDSEYS